MERARLPQRLRFREVLASVCSHPLDQRPTSSLESRERSHAPLQRRTPALASELFVVVPAGPHSAVEQAESRCDFLLCGEEFLASVIGIGETPRR